MGKKLIIKGADFHVNAITDTSYEMVGETVNGMWVGDAGYVNISPSSLSGQKIAVFEVVAGDTYTVSTDKTSSAIGFTATKPDGSARVPYVDGDRHLAYPNQPLSGVVPTGARYVSFGMYVPSVGNLFPETATFGNGYIDCEDYR